MAETPQARSSWLEKWESFTPTKRRVIVSGLIFYVVLAALLATLSGPGLAWDEPYYLAGGYHYYLPWFNRIGEDAFSKDAILDHWSPIYWHPPFGQILIGIAQHLGEGLLGRLVAGRMATAVIFAGLAAGMYLFIAKHYGDSAGVMAAASLVCMPRLFGHAHFAAMDLQVAALWFATVAAFSMGLERKAWRPVAGVLLGLSLLTKATAVPLPLLLICYAVWVKRTQALAPCLWLGLAGPVFLMWPWMWFDTVAHLQDYLGIVRDRPAISVLYFGRSIDWSEVPFHYPLVMVLATTPVLIAAAALAGAGGRLRAWRDDSTGLLLIANLIYLLAIASAPGIAKYDGVRLFLPALPFLAALSGIGLVRLWGQIRRRLSAKPWAAFAAAAAFVCYHLVWLCLYSPFYLCSFSGLVGGLPGAHRVGLETTYWGETIGHEAISYVNANAPEKARVAIAPYPHLAALFHRDQGSFRGDLVLVDASRGEPWDWLVFSGRRGMVNGGHLSPDSCGPPKLQITRFGVSLCQVFVKGGQAAESEP